MARTEGASEAGDLVCPASFGSAIEAGWHITE